MELREINISNFKMIEQMNISFQPGFNLLLGDNGAGKTTILEAITVALGGFLTGMEDVATRNILKRDIRYHIERDVNGVPNKVYYPPVEVYGKVLFDGMEYEWTRSKRGDKNEKTTMSERKICRAVQKMVNTVEQNTMWPVICYETASRGWKSTRSDAGKKLRKQINDRRCGYLGCLGEVTNMNAIKEWCYQMEWVLVRTHKQPENYVGFNAIISKFMGYMNDGLKCEVVFNPIEKELMYVENDVYMHISDLSDGYQTVLTMVIDLAYRLALLNPNAGMDICEANGIVLIDEIDSNLHPKWQWKIVDALRQTFPNIQFIAATHSPIVVSSCKDAHIIYVENGKQIKYMPEYYAYTVEDVLRGILGQYARPERVARLLEEFETAMYDEDYEAAEKILQKFKELLGESHPEVLNMQAEYDLR